MCGLPKDRGPCVNFTVKWYFDVEFGACSRFWYGGCEGNLNRFGSQEECAAACVDPEGEGADSSGFVDLGGISVFLGTLWHVRIG